MKTFLPRVMENKTGWLLALAAVLFTGGWRVLVILHQPAHWREAAEELVLPHIRNIAVNSGNTSLVYYQDSDKALKGNFYFYDSSTAKKTLLYEEPAGGVDAALYGWSSDDSFFVYAKPVENYLKKEFVICDGHSGKTLTELPVLGEATHFAWLSPRSFVYLTSHHLVEIEQNPDGQWAQARVFNNAGKGGFYFTATSSHSVAWQALGKIWEFDFSYHAPKIIWNSPTNELLGFTYSRASEEYVLNCRNADKQSCLIRFQSPRTWKTNATIVSLPENVMIPPENKPNQTVAWDKDSAAYAFLSDEVFDAFYIQTNANTKPIRLAWRGDGVNVYYLTKNYLYIAGNLTNTPGIWRYNLASQSLDQILSVNDQPFKYAKNPYPVSGMVTDAAGVQKGYFLWQPAGISAGKKKPLILTQTVLGWNSYTPVAANAGFYFAEASRAAWLAPGIQNWSSDVMDLYAAMAKNPNIDTNEVFLFGRSAETASICQLLAEKAGLWKGIILPDPAVMPDLESLRGKKIFIITGENADNVKYLKEYQDEAFAAGIPLKLILQEDQKHYATTLGSIRERMRLLTEFLLEN